MTAQTTVHSPARINPDHLAVLIVATVLTGLLAATSFMLSFAALEAVAEWAAVPPALTWAVPVFIDAAILVYTLAALVARARDESAKSAWWSLALWTVVSVTANALHAWTDIPDEARTAAGMTIAGLAPIAVLLATHTLADLVVAKPDTTAASAVGPDGQADSGRTDAAPDPLVVLEEIETAPRTDTTTNTRADGAADASTGQADGQRTGGRADSGRTGADTGHLAGRTDTGRGASGVRGEQPALELVPDAHRAGGHVYDQSADTTTDGHADIGPDTGAGRTDGHDGGQRTDTDNGRTASARERRGSVSVEAVRPQIEELARQGMSGREIAGHLGVGRTRACEIVRELREAGALVA